MSIIHHYCWFFCEKRAKIFNLCQSVGQISVNFSLDVDKNKIRSDAFSITTVESARLHTKIHVNNSSLLLLFFVKNGLKFSTYANLLGKSHIDFSLDAKKKQD